MDVGTKTTKQPHGANRTGSIASSATMTPWIAHVVPHTHWDREWYQPFEVFRARLVDVVDTVLELLTDPNAHYPRFTLDGQAVILEDYLAVRPQRRELIERLVREDRLRIGPWYVLADEFLVSPEALVRNLELGRDVSRTFGGTMQVAYTPDSFGHIAQLPRLVAEFGHKAVVFERGMGDEAETLGTEFHWTSPDEGRTCLAVNLMATYSAATALGHVDWEYEDAYDPDRAVDQMQSVLFGPEAGDPRFPDWLRTAIERIPHGITAYAQARPLLLLNGSDHLFPQRNLPDVIATLNERIDGVEFHHSDVETYVDDLRSEDLDLQTYQGEFRSSRYHHVLSGVWSTRMPVKQRNHAAETLLERYAEPLLALAAQQGRADDADLLRTAWRTLLLNHPHDSICGCSVDDVDRQMHARFDAVEQLGGSLCDRAVTFLTQQAQSKLVAFDPVPVPGWTLVEHAFDAPPGTGARQRFHDAEGRELPSQSTVERKPVAGKSDEHVDHVRSLVALPAQGLGLTPIQVQEANASEGETGVTPSDTVSVQADPDGVRLSNAALDVHVAKDGTVRLEDRASGRQHDLHLRLEDDRDAGDSYDFSPLANDIRIEGWTHTPPDVLAHGPLRGTVRLTGTLTVPAGLDATRNARTDTAPIPFDVDVSLDAFAERLDLTLHVDNQAEDHRLRLVVATGIETDDLASDGHWHLVHRPIEGDPAEHWYQRPVTTMHQRRYSAVSDGQNGLAVLARGLPEVEARHGENGTEIAVTLLRSIGWLSRDDMTSRPQGAGPALETPGAQCPGAHTFHLAIAPFQGSTAAPRLHQQSEQFHLPPRMFETGHHDPRPDLKALASPRHQGGQDDPYATIQLTLPLNLSALRTRDTGETEIRVYNPTRERVAGALHLHPAPTRVHAAILDGTLLEPIDIHDGIIDLELEPSEVLTLVCSQPLKGGDT